MYSRKINIKVAIQKHIEKKLWQKAIFELKKLIYLDDEDMSSRLKIAELYTETGEEKLAVEHYLSVANFYANKGLLTKVNEILKKISLLESTESSTDKISPRLEIINDSFPISLFANLGKHEIEKIDKNLKEKRIPKDTIVISEGDKSNSLYIVKEGILKVAIRTKENKEKFLTKLGKDDFFGELSLLTGVPRSATIATMTDTILQELTKSDFDEISSTFPNIKKVLTNYCKGREKVTKLERTRIFGRRRFERFQSNFHLMYQLVTEEGQQDSRLFDGIMKDLSLGGICIEADGRDLQFDDPLLLGKMVEVTLFLPVNVNVTIRPKGRIAWSQQATGDSIIGYKFFVGIEFVKMKEDDLLALEKSIPCLK